MPTLYVLVDCNNFFVSCERVFRPDLAHRPVVVLSNNDGCIIARSEEAKEVGIPMGAPVHLWKETMAKHRIESFSPNFPLYGDFSTRIMGILREHCAATEVYSIDEAFLRLDDSSPEEAVEFCKGLRQLILRWTGIPVSVGIARTKTLAKLAGHAAKREAKTDRRASGVHVMTAEGALEGALEKTQIEDVWGIGYRTARKLRANGIGTAADLARRDDAWIRSRMGVMGVRIAHELRGTPCFTLEHYHEAKKAIMSTRSFGRAVTKLSELKEATAAYAARAAEKLRAQGSVARYVTVYIRTGFHGTEEYYAKSASVFLPVGTSHTPTLAKAAHEALSGIYKEGVKYKKAGVILSCLLPVDAVQPTLLGDEGDNPKQRALMEAMDRINAHEGKAILSMAGEGIEKPWKMKQERRSPAYTTDLSQVLTIRI